MSIFFQQCFHALFPTSIGHLYRHISQFGSLHLIYLILLSFFIWIHSLTTYTLPHYQYTWGLGLLFFYYFLPFSVLCSILWNQGWSRDLPFYYVAFLIQFFYIPQSEIILCLFVLLTSFDIFQFQPGCNILHGFIIPCNYLYSSLYMCDIFIIHSSVFVHLGWSHIIAVVTNVAMNGGVHMSFLSDSFLEFV